MDWLFFKRRTLFRRLFFITITVAVVPLVITWLYFLREMARAGLAGEQLSLAFYSFLGFTILLSTLGAYYLSKKISRPIGYFAKMATEIARGNFEQTIDIKSHDEIGRLARIFNYMTTELRRLHAMNLNEIIRERNKTQTIIRNIVDGVIVTDPEYRVLVVNSVAEKLFGIKENEARNKPIRQVIHNKPFLDFLFSLSSEDENAGSKTRELTLKNPDTWRDIYLQARAARVTGEQDKIVGIVTIIRDITREKEIDKMKTELVSMVAHELRSPLTSISGFSELLLDEGITREQSEEYAAIILKESNRLSELINKFLDISKIEAGKSQVKKRPVQLREVLDKVLDVNLHQAERKNIAVSVRVSNQLPPVMADRDMIEQVILNLFSNAIKYSPENSAIEIRIREVNGEVVTEIEDNGYGISEQSLPRIFDKFYRAADNEAAREIAGTGLGLALVKEIVELHGGRVTVKSQLGKGSTFGFILPKHDILPDANELASIEVSMLEQ